MGKARRVRTPTFTKAELERFDRFLKSVGDRVGGVEKRPGGVVRLLTASEIANASGVEESDASYWDRKLGVQ
jgi:hypothetical protein